MIEGVLKGAVAHQDLGEASRSLRHLRASLIQPELIEKRELLADLRSKAATLGSKRGQKRIHISGFFKISAKRREGARSFRDSLGSCARFLGVRFAILTVSFALLLLFVVLSQIPLNLSMIGGPSEMAPASTIANNSIELAPVY